MRITGAIVTILVVGLGQPARADVWTDLQADQRAVQSLDDARKQVDAHRVTLEARSQDAAAEIERLKHQAPSIRRDGKLQEVLAAQKATSDELERVARDLRARGSLLTGARKKLIADCDRALTGQLAEAQRIELARLRTAQAARLALPDQPLGLARASADPLDGPRELKDKADLLRDSEDKLRREVQRLSLRIDDVERRRHLRERAGAVDEDLFGESVSNRRSPAVASARGTGDHAVGAGAPGTPTTTPAPGQGGGATGGAGGAGGSGGSGGGGGGGGSAGNPPSNGLGGGTTTGPTFSPPPSPGFASGSTSDTATVLRNLVDPATLDELRRSDGGDDLERQVRALKRAQNELNGLANELDKRARSLSSRADELKHKK